MKYVKLFEQFINEGNKPTPNPELVDKYSDFKTLILNTDEIDTDDDYIPTDLSSSKKYRGSLRAGEYKITSVKAAPQYSLNIKSATAKQGLVLITLDHTQPSPYMSIMATEEWFDKNCIFK